MLEYVDIFQSVPGWSTETSPKSVFVDLPFIVGFLFMFLFFKSAFDQLIGALSDQVFEAKFPRPFMLCITVLLLLAENPPRPTGDLVPSMQRVLLTHTFIWAVYRQLKTLYRPNKKKAKTYLLLIIQNIKLHWKTWGQEYCTQNGGDL